MHLKRIIWIANSQLRYFNVAMAHLLKEQHGCECHLYCTTDQEIEFYNGDGNPFASIQKARSLYEAVFDKRLVPKEVTARARRIEARIGCTINFLSVADRHFGRGYALAGFHHPRSRYSELVDDCAILHAFSEVIEYWEQEIADKRPTLIIGGGNILDRLAQGRDLPYRWLVASRFQNLHYWCWNSLFETPLLEPAFQALEDSGTTNSIESPYLSHVANKNRLTKDRNLAFVLKRSAHMVAQYFYWRVRGYRKARGYYLGSNLSFIWRRYRNLRTVYDGSLPKLSDLGDTEFVFFPLATEPETALQGLSPEYFYQLAAIAAVARDLPAGVKLVVKDTHTAVGRRPREFYDQIREFNQVVFLDVAELGLDIVRKASAVVTITGTSGFEAAALGIPVIVFGRHNLYGFLHHVKTVIDEADLSKYLEEIFNARIDLETARSDGQRFLEAIDSISFDMGEYNYISLENFQLETVAEALNSLTATLESTAPTPSNSN